MTQLKDKTILVVDDEADNREILSLLLEAEKCDVITASDGDTALKIARALYLDLIILDIRMPGKSGIQVLEELNKEEFHPKPPVIILTAYKNMENIERAFKAHVYTILEKPIDNKILLNNVKNTLDHFDTLKKKEAAEQAIKTSFPFENIIGKSPKILKIFKIIEKVAPSDSCITIVGETGTGKELVARALHNKSRRSGPFQAINVGALPETLLESELFGHEKGAFTDAKGQRRGVFELSKGGTVFLDEIGETNAKLQVNLLRVLEEKKLRRVGGDSEIDINVRIITATNRPLEKMVESGEFRKDLYYRINTVIIQMPPLRERRDDIPLLIEHFIAKYTKKTIEIAPEAIELLLNYDFPGNIRELEQIIERALLFQENNLIRTDDLPPEVKGSHLTSEIAEMLKIPWKEAKASFEKYYFESVIDKAGGNITEASKISGVHRTDLHQKIKKYEIKK